MANRKNELSTMIRAIQEKANWKTLRATKAIYQRSIASSNRQPRTTVFIVGCQRSGTTMLTQIFERDINTRVFPEASQLSSLDRPSRLRLNPLESVREVIDHQPASIVVLKPLVESQNTPELLDYFENSKALWLYRHYKDVAASYVTKWGEGHSAKALRAMIEKHQDDWRIEHLPESVYQIVCQHFSEDLDSHDASALFWYVRNSFFFARQLDTNPRVMLLKYEELVANPIETIGDLYEFIGQEFPGEKIVSMVHESSRSKGQNIRLSPEIDCLCSELMTKLDNFLRTSKHGT